jgi:hypothetical protein
MPEVRLHLDADASRRSLHQALLDRGHDVTRTPSDWIRREADDETQLLGATAQGRCLFTFNIRDFMLLARLHPHHRGILLANQQSWAFPALLTALDRFLREADADHVMGQILWLNSWR